MREKLFSSKIEEDWSKVKHFISKLSDKELL